MIGTVYKNQASCIRALLRLYAPAGVDIDLTFGNGVMWSKLKTEPKIKLDIFPRRPGVTPGDSRKLLMDDKTVSSVMFDPPFILDSSHNVTGIMKNKYGWFSTYPVMMKYFRETMREVFRLLKPLGVLIFKIQDTIDGRRNYITHVDVIRSAGRIGFRCEDIFILVNKNRLPIHNLKKQQHARKEHSFFIVFQKPARIRKKKSSRENKNQLSLFDPYTPVS